MTAPAMPRPVGRRSFLKQTVAEWESWPWESWSPSQAAHATRTIVLIDDLNRAATADERIKLDQAVRQALRVLGLTKKDDEDEGPSEEDIAKAKRARAEGAKVRSKQQAIRLGVEAGDELLRFRDRGGRVHDIRNALITDEWDAYPDDSLQGERQAQAEADGAWPEFTVKPDADTQIPSPQARNSERQ